MADPAAHIHLNLCTELPFVAFHAWYGDATTCLLLRLSSRWRHTSSPAKANLFMKTRSCLPRVPLSRFMLGGQKLLCPESVLKHQVRDSISTLYYHWGNTSSQHASQRSCTAHSTPWPSPATTNRSVSTSLIGGVSVVRPNSPSTNGSSIYGLIVTRIYSASSARLHIGAAGNFL